MKRKDRNPKSEGHSEQRLPHTPTEDESSKGQGRKKKSLLEKLDTLSDGIKACHASHEQMITALSQEHNKLADDLQRQLMALRENISGPERKKSKKAKLADALTDLQKAGKKLRLKPELGRTKDLDRIEGFFLKTYQTLDALNDKFMKEHEAAEPPQHERLEDRES